jgi:hypothetical protein
LLVALYGGLPGNGHRQHCVKATRDNRAFVPDATLPSSGSFVSLRGIDFGEPCSVGANRSVRASV